MRTFVFFGLLLFVSAIQAASLPSALQPAALQALKAGIVVEVEDGQIETTGYIRIEDLHGSEASPIIIRAANRGRSIIAGHAGFALKNCSHLMLEGFVFENDANQQAIQLTDCQHVRITRCHFRLNEKLNARWSQHWVYILGSKSGHNRVDHCLFEQQSQKGSMVFARGDDTTLTPSQHDRIDHNHFRDVIYAEDSNGHETLRTGSNDMGAAGKSTFTLIEYNLLERCSGEQEIISLKSSGNIVRNNTFLDCRGSICLRLGNRTEVTGNIMLNPGNVPGTGGIKIYGFEHHVSGNFFENLTGTGHVAPLALIPGTMDTESTNQIGKAYKDNTTAPATRVIISQNIWLNCSPLVLGQDKADKERHYLPRECVFKDNLVAHVASLKSPLLKEGLVENIQTSGNTAYQEPIFTKSGGEKEFQWLDTLPPIQRPRPLSAQDVGPNSVEN